MCTLVVLGSGEMKGKLAMVLVVALLMAGLVLVFVKPDVVPEQESAPAREVERKEHVVAPGRDPGDADFKDQYDELFMKGEFKDLVELVKGYKGPHRDTAWYWNMLGDAHVGAENFQEAAACYEKTLGYEYSWNVYLNLAECLLQQGEYARAAGMYGKLYQEDVKEKRDPGLNFYKYFVCSQLSGDRLAGVGIPAATPHHLPRLCALATKLSNKSALDNDDLDFIKEIKKDPAYTVYLDTLREVGMLE